ncbi:MAG TPA: prepilin-type N-terminal cleavage/methylation domain-containing protein [Rhizomicrobium sp.]|jgi:general secretion pathway protein H
MRTIGRSARADDGFTLLELLVVLAVMGLLIAAAPAIIAAARPGRDALAVTRALAEDLRTARAIAVRENRMTSFALQHGHAVTLPAGPSYDIPPSVPVRMVGTREGQPNGRIDFFPDGSATGSLLLIGTAEHQHRILVHWLTGQVVDD